MNNGLNIGGFWLPRMLTSLNLDLAFLVIGESSVKNR